MNIYERTLLLPDSKKRFTYRYSYDAAFPKDVNEEYVSFVMDKIENDKSLAPENKIALTADIGLLFMYKGTGQIDFYVKDVFNKYSLNDLTAIARDVKALKIPLKYNKEDRSQ